MYTALNQIVFLLAFNMTSKNDLEQKGTMNVTTINVTMP